MRKEGMEPVGFLGVLKLSILIIHRNLKHFLCIALILALPGALQAVLLPDTSTSIRSFVTSLYRLLLSDQEPRPAVIDPSNVPSHHVAAEMTSIAFSLAVSLACTPLLTFSVCRACLGKSVDMKGSAKGIVRSVGNLLITTLCVVAAAVVVGIAAGLVFGIASLVGGTAGVMIRVAWVLAAGVGILYVAVGLSLAGTVAILEESRGWEAMRRSMYLVGHKKGVTLGLWLLFLLCGLLLLPVLVSSDSRWIALSLGVPGNALLGLFSAVSCVVLYMSCRAGLQEPLDTLVAASAQFGPLDPSHAKYLDLETASLATLST
ncbi:hypothetical protein L7F22_018808 [Adiantum nelumboides]|nr:hypothetical protein [Adiantum nelumboides]